MKNKIDKKAVIKEAIKHWQHNLDMLTKLDANGKGISTCVGSNTWYDDCENTFEKGIFFGAEYCALCEVYSVCCDCPLAIADQICKEFHSPWHACVKAEGNKDIIKAADTMLLALQSLLIDTRIYKGNSLPECEITFDTAEEESEWLFFRVDGTYSEQYDRSTGQTECEGEITELYMWVDGNNWIKVDCNMLPNKLWNEIEEEWYKWVKNNPKPGPDKDDIGDIKFHEMRDEGRI